MPDVPRLAEVVSVCPNCSAYVKDAEVHENWHTGDDDAA